LRFTPSTGPVSAAPNKGIASSLVPSIRRPSTRAPAAAGASTAAAKQVWVLRNGAAVSVAVVPGISDGHMTEITGGDLQAGMLVIIDQKAGNAP